MPMATIPERLTEIVAGLHFPERTKKFVPPAAAELLRQTRILLLSLGLPRDKSFEQPMEHKAASGSMSIIVPIHDAPFVTLRCLTSLERYASDSEIILVDDASTLKETKNIIRDFSDRNGWRVLSNRTALGHSGACMAAATLSSRPYLCFLNSDTVVTPWCWLPIEMAFQLDPRIAVAGPCTSASENNEQTIPRAAHCRFRWNDSQICAFAKKTALIPPDPNIVDLPIVKGFAFFIRREVWRDLKGFDANLADYGNDDELCQRVTALGYRVVWVRNSYIHHLGSQSYGAELSSDELLSRRLAATTYLRKKHNILTYCRNRLIE